MFFPILTVPFLALQRLLRPLISLGLAAALLAVYLVPPSFAQTSGNQSVFTTQTPASPNVTDSTSYELGMKFVSAKAGQITAIRYWKASSDTTTTHTGKIWAANGTTPLASVNFTGETASGWQQQTLATPLAIQANTTYIVSVNTSGYFAFTKSGLATAITNGDVSSVADGANGLYGPAGSRPTSSYSSSNYFRDIVFVATTGGTSGASTITKTAGDSQTGTVGTALSTPLTAQLKDGSGNPLVGTSVSFAVTAGGGSLSSTTVSTNSSGNASSVLTLGTTAGSNTVTATAGSIGSVTFSATGNPAAANKLALTPASTTTTANAAVSYQAKVQDQYGNTVTTATASVTFSASGVTGSFSPSATVNASAGIASVTFTPSGAGTATLSASATGLTGASATLTVNSAPSGTNQSVFTTQTPASPNVTDNTSYELGMKFVSAKAGQITAIRYWKASSDTTTTHTGKIWSASGTLLASVNFTGETASGWQQQTLATPLSIQASTTYVVSVNTSNYFAFTNGALASAVVNGDLSSVADGANGVYGSAGNFPTSSYQNSNYFRDIVFVAGSSGGSSGSSTIAKTAGDSQTGTVGTALSTPLTVQLKDGSGNPLVGTSVSFAITAGGGSLSSTTMSTNSSGNASSTLTLGTTAGSNTVTATASGIGSVTFSATGNPATASKLTLSPTSATSGPNTGVSYQAKVQDQYGNTVTTATTSVSFSASGVTGSFSPSAAVNASAGIASVTFTTGSSSGSGTITATASGLTSASGTLTVSTGNPIYLENLKPGTTNWQIPSGSKSGGEIAGFAGALSVNKGEALPLMVSFDVYGSGGSPSQILGQYTVEVYRLGYYGGTGGRLMTTLGPINGYRQADCLIGDQATRLVECKWLQNATIQTGSDWTTGLYAAKLIDGRNGKQAYVWFVVRDDASHSDLLFQSSVNTFNAYNYFGGYQGGFSLYRGNDGTYNTRAFKVSFDRPYADSIGSTDPNNPMGQEYGMAYWLERQSYDVSYTTNLDVSLNASLLQQHKGFLSVGHDEYWTMEERQGVQQARDAGIHLGFFTANAAYWRVRYEPSTSGTPNRVMVCYKEAWAQDPVAPTTRFRDYPNYLPENALLGVMYIGDYNGSGYPWVVSNASDPIFANTGVTNGSAFYGIVGWEWDAVVSNGQSPSGLVTLSASPVTATTLAPADPGDPNNPSNISTSTSQTANGVRYTAASGAKVFASGAIQWANGLSTGGLPFQQLNVNILSNMGVKPYTPTSGLIVP
ncbi:N,N-dimethylformamidase beta subunit family domain-containing protein [Gloeobacter kilaueensis]|uniref:Big-1 domain-containing protein n=1 Tax=Gloeobacter kilaueensis (strain ATCC BAA-2537 / CCAP 1431/1 / ULC 316 / JS1) TaxID=1183438 RepID=U5QCQ9_GLOK1|nr:N,N-dimethylformamidase beta subunit family domain-containing protein [Gloeobacter kilaueensis]AGY56707.1 hypothetical protein GKIL_0461 [Gloeobacter kilaueensis JS1]